MIRLNVQSGDLNKKLDATAAALHGIPLSKALLRSGLTVAAQAQRNVTAGGTGLRVRSGRLRSSIVAAMQSPTVVAIGTNVIYAGIHEHGGITRAHTIVPRRANVLAFNVGGRAVFARRVNHPGSVIPARPYLGPALDRRRAEVLSIIRDVYAGPLAISGTGA